MSGRTMLLRSEAVPVPRTVRYCWGSFKPGNLHGVAGALPLTPFELAVE